MRPPPPRAPALPATPKQQFLENGSGKKTVLSVSTAVPVSGSSVVLGLDRVSLPYLLFTI